MQNTSTASASHTSDHCESSRRTVVTEVDDAPASVDEDGAGGVVDDPAGPEDVGDAGSVDVGAAEVVEEGAEGDEVVGAAAVLVGAAEVGAAADRSHMTSAGSGVDSGPPGSCVTTIHRHGVVTLSRASEK